MQKFSVTFKLQSKKIPAAYKKAEGVISCLLNYNFGEKHFFSLTLTFDSILNLAKFVENEIGDSEIAFDATLSNPQKNLLNGSSDELLYEAKLVK